MDKEMLDLIYELQPKKTLFEWLCEKEGIEMPQAEWDSEPPKDSQAS